MEYGQHLMSQEFNKNFSDIHNCKIVAPPYYPGEVPQTFFLAKRDAFLKEYSEHIGTALDGYSEILDYQRFDIAGQDFIYWFLVRDNLQVKLIHLHAVGSSLGTVTQVGPTRTFVE